MEQLLQLVQKKNSLVAEEAELMITVQELNLRRNSGSWTKSCEPT